MHYPKILLCLLFFAVPAFYVAAQSTGDMYYTVNKGVIYFDKGLPQSPLWFADSRLAFSFDEAGISQLDYYNPVHDQGMPTLFLRQLWDGFRYYLEKDNKSYKPSYSKSKIWPFGIESEWNIDSLKMQQRVMAIDQSIVLQITVPENMPTAWHFKLEFFEAFGLSKGSDDDLRYTDGNTTRQWFPWKFDAAANILEGGFSAYTSKQDGKATSTFESHCSIAANFPMEHLVRPINPKHILKSQELVPGNTYTFLICFAQELSLLHQKNNKLLQTLPNVVEQQFERYRKTADKAPILTSPYTDLNNFISLAPMYHESLKITDCPGAMRAKTSNYWVWGWDGMTSNEATGFWGDTAHLKNLLLFYETTADSAKGIAHAFAYDMKPVSISALPAQGMYISLLQLYYANTGDTDWVRKRYPFAKTVFNRIAASEVAGTGFCKGSSLFPDFPDAMGETGNDISGFNNTIFYCAARSMEWLASLTGDHEQRIKSAGITKRFEQHFEKLFFDPGKGYIVSSIDSKTLQQRESYTTNAIRWENNYCADITDSISKSCLQFFKENAVTPMGLREIPLWNKSFDADANQLHCWWPATGEYFVRLINRYDQPKLIDQWITWVSYWTKHLTCPEGICYYFETENPEFDRWTSQKGTWQGYSMRGWYQAAIHGIVGVGTDAGGITFYPYSGKEMRLEGLNYRNKKFDIDMKGSGPYIESINVDGVIIKASNKLPADINPGKKTIKIVVNRVAVDPYPVTFLEGTAVEITGYSYKDGSIIAKLSGAGFCRLRFRATRPFAVRIGGKKVHVDYDAAKGQGFVAVNLQPGHSLQMRVH